MAADVSFILGRAGSGKTELVLGEIAEKLLADPLGPPVWLVVPRQATFETQRRLLARPDGPRAQCRCRVVSFDRLADLVLRAAGGAAVPQVTPLGRVLLLSDELRRHQSELRHFKRSAREPGTAEVLAEFFDDLDRADRTLEEVEAAVSAGEALPEAIGPRLRAKLADVALLGRAVRGRLAGRIDPLARRRAAAQAAAVSPLFDKASIHVDGFWELDAHHRRLLAAAAKRAAAVVVTVVGDPHAELPLFDRHRAAADRLRGDLRDAGVARFTTRPLTEPARFAKGSAVASVECEWPGPCERITGGGLRLVACGDPAAEADAAARQVQDWLAGGMRLRDVLIMARDLGTYLPLVERSFAEHGLPMFVDRRRAGGHHPLVRLVQFALSAAAGDFPQNDLIALAKTRLAGLAADEAHDLEKYVRRHRPAGADAWLAEDDWDDRDVRRVADEELETDAAARADALRRRLAEPLRPMAGLMRREAIRFDDLAAAVARLLEDFGSAKALAKLSENRPEQAEVDAQVWAAVADVLAQAHELMGPTQAAPAEAAAALDGGLSAIDVAVVPPTVDAVLVGGVDRVRPPAVRAAVVLGLGAGQFPRFEADPPVLSDLERQAIRRAGVEIARDADDRLAFEQFLAYHAFTRAGERLTLTRPRRAADGNVVEPGDFWRQLADAGATEERDAPVPATPRQAAVRVADWARGGADDADAAALYEHYFRRLDWSARPEPRRAWAALAYENAPALPAALARRLYGERVCGGPGRFERFAACPFKHFAADGLRLDDPPPDEPTPLDEGNVLHAAMEAAVRELMDKGYDFAREPGAAEEWDRFARRHAAAAMARVGRRAVRRSRQADYLEDRLARELRAALVRELHAWRLGAFRPALLETTFGEDRDRPAPDVGPDAALVGRIDRVDHGDGWACVVDYKRSGETLSRRRIEFGLQLQLLTYLRVAGAEARPAGGLYVPLRRKIDRVAHPDDVADDPLRPMPTGVVVYEAASQFKRGYASGDKDAPVPLHINKDGSIAKRSQGTKHAAELAGLLETTCGKIGEFGSQILAGTVAVRPFRDGKETACQSCAYRAACRHEPARNGYRPVPQTVDDAGDGGEDA